MKKIALFLSIVVAAVACEQAEPVTPPEFDFANPDVTIPYQGCQDEPVTIQFNVNMDWTAELDQTYDWLSFTGETSGAAGDASVSLVATANSGTETRTAVIIVKAGVSVLTFDVVQEGYPAVTVTPETLEFETAGGTQEVTVNANVEYVANVPENDWLTFEYNKETSSYTVTAAENTGYAPRTLTITLVNNIDGVSESIVVSQPGRVNLLWEASYADYNLTAETISNPVHIAYAYDKLILSTGNAVHLLNPETGAYESTLALPEGVAAITSLTTDNAGHVLVTTNDVAFGGSTDIYVVTAIEPLAFTKLATMTNADVSGSVGGNLRVTGDVTANAVMTMFTSGMNYLLYCPIVGGVASEKTSFIDVPENVGIAWSTSDGCAVALGSEVSAGFLATHYPEDDLYYCADPSAWPAQWTSLTPEPAWPNGINNSIDIATYDSVNYAVVGVGSYWSWSTTGVYLFDLTQNAVVYTYFTSGDIFGEGAYTSSDVTLVSTDAAMYIYYVDHNRGLVNCFELK